MDLRRSIPTLGGAADSTPDFTPVALQADEDSVQCRYYTADEAVAGVAYVGGVGGGWDTPARGLYPRLAAELRRQRVAGLRVRFRRSTQLSSCVADLGLAVEFLLAEGIPRLGLVGHSLGGAAVIQAAAASSSVHTVVALAPQSAGAHDVNRLAPRCSILLLHGLDDTVLSARTAGLLYRRAGEPKRLELLPGTGHMLDESAEEVHSVVLSWILEQLTGQTCIDRTQQV